MKIGLYATPNRNLITSFADGVLASGSSPVWQNPSVFNEYQREKFDFIAIWGGGGPRAREVIDTYAKVKIQALVFEGGYVGNNTASISINKHYWLPEFECPPDRMEKFELKLSNEQKKDGYVLVLGQSLQANVILERQVGELDTKRKVVFRPHPSVDFNMKGAEKLDGSFDEALAGAFCVLCHTSNSANTAILKGIPVFCSAKSMAAELANTDIDKIDDPYFPTDEERTSYFSRLCYAVWTVKEIKDGTAFEFYSNIIMGEQPIKKGVTKSVSELKGKFEGKTAYIVGKGPSLKYLTKEDFKGEGGLVTPLNEAVKIVENINLPSSFFIISQQKDGKPECMVKPEKAPLLLHSKESKGWFENHPVRYIFDLQKHYNLKNNGVSVLNGNCCSVVAAIEFVKYAGCKKIVFLCFDSYTDNINEYPKDDRLGKLHSIPERLEHLKGQKVQIPIHTKGIKTEFVRPEEKKEPFTVITLTGDRPDAFRLCKKYMDRQTVQPAQWIVVDDGKRVLPTKYRDGLDYYRRKSNGKEPGHTLRLNMLEAIKHIKHDRVVIVEDDDWYRNDYLELSLKHLGSADLVGQDTFFYWNVIEKAFHKIKKTNRPAMCLTAFKSPVFETLEMICLNDPVTIETAKEQDRINSGSVDLSLWSRWTGTKKAYNEGENLCVGIKGVKGRKGHTLGHTKALTSYFEPDPIGKMLKQLIGEDAKNYIEV